MDTKSLIVGGVVGILIGIGISSVGGEGNFVLKVNRSQTNVMDRHFIEQMIPHHEGAIAMAQIALERSKRPEIISLAKGIIEAQEKEIIDMKAWYEAWFGEPVSSAPQHMMNGQMMGGGMMHMSSMSGDMEVLKSAKDFDQEFIRQMIPHHEMAVMMARMLQSSTKRSEMQGLADAIITSQSREIQMMRSWSEAWSR